MRGESRSREDTNEPRSELRGPAYRTTGKSCISPSKMSAPQDPGIRSSHGGEQLDFPDRIAPAEQHHQPVDSDADAARRRHSVLQREDVVLVVGLRLLVAAFP